MTRKSKRAKACDIPMSVKRAVHERDGELCILCSRLGAPNAHFISRAQGGLGIEQNIVTLCHDCHTEYDHTAKRKVIRGWIEHYLRLQYPEWNEEDLVYSKMKGLEG